MIKLCKPCLRDGSLSGTESDVASGQASDAGHMRRVRVCCVSTWNAVFLVCRRRGGVSHHPNSNCLLWWGHSCMIVSVNPKTRITKLVLLAPPLSICHAAGTQTCTRLDWSCSTDTEHRLKPCRRDTSCYVPDCLSAVLDQRQGVRRSRLPLVLRLSLIAMWHICIFSFFFLHWKRPQGRDRFTPRAKMTDQQEEKKER